MFVGAAVQLCKGFSHHVQLGLAVAFEDLCIALPQHESDEMVRNSACAEPAGEGVPEVVEREVWERRLVSALKSRLFSRSRYKALVDVGFCGWEKVLGLSASPSICALKARAASLVIGMSPMPLGVLESGMWTTEFSRSTSDFFIGISSL